MPIGEERTYSPEVIREAERNWRRINAESRARGCFCGGPAECVSYHPMVGSVPKELWTCKQHEGVEMWEGKQGYWGHDHPCPEGLDAAWSGPIGGEPSRWFCPHQTHEEASRGA